MDVIVKLIQFGSVTLSRAKGSIVEFSGDCIVNAANEGCIGGGGVDGAISLRGGDALLRARKALPLLEFDTRCRTGDAVITIGGLLPAKFVVHAVGPDIRIARNEAEYDQCIHTLQRAYQRSMEVASSSYGRRINSIAFSLISAGVFKGDVPLDRILEAAVRALWAWVRSTEGQHPHCPQHILLVGFGNDEFDALGRVWEHVQCSLSSAAAISTRARHFSQGHHLPYVGRFFTAVRNQYSPVVNPTGQIPMAVAENKLCHFLLEEKLSEFKHFTATVFNYNVSTGSPQLKAVLSRFLSAYVFKGTPVAPEHLVIAPGCCAILHQLAYLLLEEGDGVLVPTPYYPAFDHDFLNLGKAICIEVNTTMEPSMELSAAALDQAWETAILKRAPPKVLLLTNPSNPLGVTYSQEILQLAISWTAGRGIHLVVDEIYALSIFSHIRSGTPYPFCSVATIMAEQAGREAVAEGAHFMGDHVHCLWSLSKDFGSSGFRVGCLYTQSAALLKAMSSMTDMMQVSNLAQEICIHLLSDHEFITHFLEENRRRLIVSYDVLRDGILSLPIPLTLVPAQSGIFAFVDFRPWIRVFSANKSNQAMILEGPEDAWWAMEEAFALHLFERVGIVLTPGRSCHCQVAGFFRVCYAWVPLETLEEGLRRMRALQIELLGLQGDDCM